MSRQLRPSPNCLNCGTAVATRFCAECGQENTSYRVSLARLVGDLVEELFQLESRLWRTLWTLFRRPGLLTVEYNAGRRVRWTTPLRLYLIASVTYFFGAGMMERYRPPPDNVKFDMHDMTDAERAELQQKAPLFRKLADRAAVASKDPKGTQRRIRAELDQWMPRIAAGMVPFLAVLTWLFFRRPKLYFVEHLVFALHEHAFGFFILVVALIRWGPLMPLALLASLVWMFVALRRIFGQSRWRTGWKVAVVTTIYSIVVGIVAAAVAVVGFFGDG